MKLTNPENISENEKDFIDTINAELDWEAIEKMLLEKHNFTLQEEIDYKNGDLIVYDNQIAYKFDFDIKVPLSVIFNREGECLEISTLRKDFHEDEEDEIVDQESSEEESLKEDSIDAQSVDNQFMEETQNIVQEKKEDGKISKMASNIADMISEINKEDQE